MPTRGAASFPTWAAAEAATHASRTRRHFPAGLFTLALVAAIIEAAGPVIRWRTQTGWPVILVIDFSGSVEEPDIAPSRIGPAHR